MKRYEGFDTKLLEYTSDNGNATIKDTQAVVALLKGGMDAKQNKEATDNVYQLGWNSALAFHTSDGAYHLDKLYSYNKESKEFEEQTIAPLTSIRSIVTHGVDSCTFVFITNGDRLFMGHFDVDQLPKGLGLITKRMGSGGSTIYCSALDEEDEKIFVDSLRMIGAVYYYSRGQVAHGAKHCAHAEIGVELIEPNNVLYGDKILIHCDMKGALTFKGVKVFAGNNSFETDPFSSHCVIL